MEKLVLNITCKQPEEKEMNCDNYDFVVIDRIIIMDDRLCTPQKRCALISSSIKVSNSLSEGEVSSMKENIIEVLKNSTHHGSFTLNN